MINIPDNIDSKYRFVILSALRARQLQSGYPPAIQDTVHKSTTLAQHELLGNHIKFHIPGQTPPAAKE